MNREDLKALKESIDKIQFRLKLIYMEIDVLIDAHKRDIENIKGVKSELILAESFCQQVHKKLNEHIDNDENS